MKDQKRAETIASERMQLLSPLLAEGLDTAKASQIKRQICEQTGLSERTLRRYLAKYRQEGFGGVYGKIKIPKMIKRISPKKSCKIPHFNRAEMDRI